jgi:hypothetical protein
VTADGQYVTGLAESLDETGYRSVLYCADAAGSWRVPIENTPDAGLQAFSKTGRDFAFAALGADSLYVGELTFTDANR